MKGSAITGPVGKEAAELWPVGSPHLEPVSCSIPLTDTYIAYCVEFRCGDVRWWFVMLAWMRGRSSGCFHGVVPETLMGQRSLSIENEVHI